MAVLRRIKPDDLCYVTATCKRCENAFMLPDSISNGRFNDYPPTDFYCPECEAKGFKNKRRTGKPTPDEFIEEEGIKDKTIIKVFKKMCKDNPYNKTFNRMLKDAKEIASYYKDEQGE